MKRFNIIIAIMVLLLISGCRTMEGPGAAAGAGTYPLDTEITGEETILATQVDATKAGGFAIVRIAGSDLPISDAAQAALDLKQDASTAATDSELSAGLATKLDEPTGTPDGTKFARDDGTWATPPGSTITADGTDPTKAAVAVLADTASAVPGSGITGAVPESVIDADITRDSELTSGLSGKQDLDADLTDLADGELTGSKVGTGINGTNITTGTVAAARIDTAMATDSEVTSAVAGKQDTITSSTDITMSDLTADSVTTAFVDGSSGVFFDNDNTTTPNLTGKKGIWPESDGVHFSNDGTDGGVIGTGGSSSNLDTTNFAGTAIVDTSEALTQGTTDLMIPTWGAVLAKLNDLLVTGNPSIAITTPASDGTWVDSLTYTSFAGTAFDLQGISAIEWKLESGGTYADTGVTGTTDWSVSSITLQEGANELYARVTDTDTNTSETNITLNADSIDPINADGGTDATHDGSTNITLDVDVTEANISTVTFSSTELSLTDVAMSQAGTAPNYTYTAFVDPNGSTSTIDLVVTSTDLAGNYDTDTYNVTYSGGSSYLFEWAAENLTAEAYSEGDGTVTAASEGTPTYSFVSGQVNNAIQLTAGTWVRIPATQGGNIDYSSGGMQFYYSYESGTPSGSSYIVTSTYASPSEFMLRRSSTSDTLLILYWAGTSYEITTTENLFTPGLKSVAIAYNCAAQTWSLTIGSSNYPVSLSSTDVPSPPTTQYVYFNGFNATSSNQTVIFDEVKIQ